MKKMRRLIPAIAMLLVSAVMLSTASFAWFTMNEEVTATGMEVKAKASGSLLISVDPLSASNAGAPEATVTAEGVQNLLPMAYDAGYTVDNTNPDAPVTNYNVVQGAQLQLNQTSGWYKPANNKANNIVTGFNSDKTPAGMVLVGDDLNDVISEDDGSVEAKNEYHWKEEFYVATATDAMVGATLTIDMSYLKAPTDANNKTYKAYAAAIYVVNKTMQVTDEDTQEVSTVANPAWTNGADIDFATAVPNAIVFVDTAKDRNVANITGVTIPSVAGAIGTETVGLKVIVHFYVDGALTALKDDGSADTVQVDGASIYTQAYGEYDPTKSYTVVTAVQTPVLVGQPLDGLHTRTGSATTGYTYTPVYGIATAETESTTAYYKLTTTTGVANDDIKDGIEYADNWFTSSVQKVASEYTYVRTADIPSEGTSLVLTMGAKPAAGN